MEYIINKKEYYPITKSEMDSLLEQYDFEIIDINDDRQLRFTKEYVYQKQIRDNIFLRIYSSITSDNLSRDVGEDAIRLCWFYYDDNTNQYVIFDKSYKTKRIYNWKTNLTKKIEALIDSELILCPVCSSPMKIQENKRTGSKFWGCIQYRVTECKGTRKLIV